MKQIALIALLALASFTALPVAAADTQPEAAVAAAPENLSAPGKPCNKPGMGGMGMSGMGMGAGMGAGMPGMHRMMMGEGCDCPKPGAHGDCKHHGDLSDRMRQMEKRLDALQMTLEMLVRQQGE